VRPTTIHARSAEIEMMTIPMTEMRLTQTAMSPPLTTHFLNVRTISHAMTETSVVNGETPEIMRITSMSLQPLYTTAVTASVDPIARLILMNVCQNHVRTVQTAQMCWLATYVIVLMASMDPIARLIFLHQQR
jgi:hypothetical protein